MGLLGCFDFWECEKALGVIVKISTRILAGFSRILFIGWLLFDLESGEGTRLGNGGATQGTRIWEGISMRGLTQGYAKDRRGSRRFLQICFRR